MNPAAFIAAVAAILTGLAGPARGVELVMFRQALCEWCQTWDQEVGGVYSKTPQGRMAPLRELNIGERPTGLAQVKPVVFTPTFVLVHQGREVGRIQGYPGAGFFWELLDEMLKRLPKGH